MLKRGSVKTPDATAIGATMFHRYITHNGQQIDFDRATWMMDKSVLADAVASLPSATGQTEFDRFIAARMGFPGDKPRTKQDDLQALWDNYCAKHANKYGSEFSPDVM